MQNKKYTAEETVKSCQIQQDIMFQCVYLLISIKRHMELSTMQRNDMQ